MPDSSFPLRAPGTDTRTEYIAGLANVISDAAVHPLAGRAREVPPGVRVITAVAVPTFAWKG